jgi:SAM-dependent methyltransferase
VTTEATVQALVQDASAYYRAAGTFAWHFARGKLKADPAYRFILKQGLLRDCTRLLDLGAGQGLLAAWLLAAHSRHASDQSGAWPRDWPPPPLLASYTGIEINAQEVRRARRAFALDTAVHIQMLHADIAVADYGQADAVVLLDVLHYNDFSAQEHILQCARAALTPGGLLLLRVGDASGGPSVAVSKALDRTVALMRRGRWLRLHCRARADWEQLMVRQGFVPRALTRNSAATFSNTLLLGEAA